MGWNVEVQAVVLEVITGASAGFTAQKVCHGPVVGGEEFDGEGGIALAGMGREVDGHQVEL